MDTTPDTTSSCQDRPTPWMPLDALVERWASFGRQTGTAAATKATSEAFAAIAEEREALHAYNRLDKPQHTGQVHQAYQLNRHEYILAALYKAATHWFNTACALEAYLECGSIDEAGTTLEQDLYPLIGDVLEQRERVWCITLAIIREQVRSYRIRPSCIEPSSAIVRDDGPQGDVGRRQACNW